MINFSSHNFINLHHSNNNHMSNNLFNKVSFNNKYNKTHLKYLEIIKFKIFEKISIQN